jgi:choline dehydrogenase-like flavoprotein
MREDVLVVGAGVSGLYAALVAARRGARVRVIERSPRPGGLAASERFRGVPCDLGSHRLHPEALDRPLFRELHAHEPLLVRPRRGVVIVRGRHVPYPPSALALLAALGPAASARIAVGFAAHRGRRGAFTRWERDRASPGDDAGFERFVEARVGREAYEAFYAPYARKVWGVAPSELSQIVAKKRLSSERPLTLLRGAAARALGLRAAVDPTFLYPARGIASIVAYLEERLLERGVPIETERAYDPARDAAGAVLFAGDLRDLTPTTLAHRGLYLVLVAFRGTTGSAAETFYCPGDELWFGRVSDISRYSPALHNPGETILCVEIPEGALGSPRDFTVGGPGRALLDQLRRARVLPRDAEVLEVRQRFLPAVYPLYLRGFQAEWRAAMQRVARAGNVLPIGRQALFLHVNLDHCADIALAAVDHLDRGESAASWIARAEAYLEVRVRD